MNKTLALGATLALALSAGATQAAAADLDCKLDFSLTSWSLVYKHVEGDGVVRCENGDSMPVRLVARGGGLTVGKSKIEDGHGSFTDIRKITDVLGNYAQGEVHAGLVKSGNASVLSKGDVQLALAGHGEGVDIGIDLSKLTIKEAHVAKSRR